MGDTTYTNPLIEIKNAEMGLLQGYAGLMGLVDTIVAWDSKTSPFEASDMRTLAGTSLILRPHDVKVFPFETSDTWSFVDTRCLELKTPAQLIDDTLMAALVWETARALAPARSSRLGLRYVDKFEISQSSVISDAAKREGPIWDGKCLWASIVYIHVTFRQTQAAMAARS